MAKPVETPHRFKDTYLLSHMVGRKLAALCCRIGKPAAMYIESHPWLKPPVGVFLLPVVGMAWLMLSTGVMSKLFMVLLILLCSAMAVRRLGSGKKM